MKRYAVDRSTLVESLDGAVVMAADLPVEALEHFRTPYHSAIWMARFFTFEQYNALRDLLLAMKEQEETK